MDVTAPVWSWPGDDDIAGRAGQCYTLAMEAVLANLHLGDRLFLVHGLLHADRSSQAEQLAARPEGCPPANPHAWAEVEADDGTIALDPVLRMWDARDGYYAAFGAEVVRRYRADVAVSVAMRRGDYGPWDRRSNELWQLRQEQARANPEWSSAATLERYFDMTEARGG